MNRTLAIVLALAAGGCATELTSAGREVRLFEGDAVDRCTLVAVVSATSANGASNEDNERIATIMVRNRVAAKGGNAYTIIAREVTPLSTTVKADALRCPYWEPIKGLAPLPPGAPATRARQPAR
jgi:hypothetical protein